MKRSVYLFPAILLLAACESSPGAPADLAVPDMSEVPADLAVVVDQQALDLTPVLDLTGTIAGDRCEYAIALTPGVTTAGDTTPMANDYQFAATSQACTAELKANGYAGPDSAYVVTVPAGKMLTVTLTPKLLAGTWYPMLALVSDCAQPGPSCLAAKDIVVPNGNPRIVSYTNSGAAAQRLFVLVDSIPGSAGKGAFDLRADLN